MDDPKRDVSHVSLDSPNVRKAQQSIPPGLTPGLSSAQDFPPLAAPSQPPPAPKPLGKATSTLAQSAIKPAVPVIPTTASKPPLTNKQLLSQDAEKAEESDVSRKPTETENEQQKDKSPIAADAKQDEMQVDLKSQSADKKIDPPKTKQKRQKVSTLNISIEKKEAPKGSSISKPAEEGPTSKMESKADQSQAASSSQPATPSTTLSQPSAPSSQRQGMPKPSRSNTTSRFEADSPGVLQKSVSRRPSLASLNQPDTPLSEKISDNASYTSNPISRASSPPLAKVGSAPSRQVTKSQQKKERQARAKQLDDAAKREDSAAKIEEEIIQAPIVGRKKKTKKSKDPNDEAKESPSVERPDSLGVRDIVGTSQETVSASHSKPTTDPRTSRSSAIPSEQDAETPSVVASSAAAEDFSTRAPAVTSASVFADLQALDELRASVSDILLKSVSGVNARYDLNLDPHLTLSHPQDLTPEQLAELDTGKPISIALDKDNAVIVFPNRRCLRGFSPSQVERYKELYSAVTTCMYPAILHHFGDTMTPDPQIRQMLEVLMPPYYNVSANGASSTMSKNAAVAPNGQSNFASPSSGEEGPLLHNRFAQQTSQHQPPPLSVSPYPRAATTNTTTSNPSASTKPSNVTSILPQQSSTPAATTKTSTTATAAANSDSISGGAKPGPTRIPTVAEAEAVLAAERKNAEALEKKLNALIKKNRKMVFGAATTVT